MIVAFWLRSKTTYDVNHRTFSARQFLEAAALECFTKLIRWLDHVTGAIGFSDV